MLIQLHNSQPIGKPVATENFRALFPNVSFPALLTPEDVESYGFGIFSFTIAPEPAKYQKVIELSPARNSDGIWEQSWSLVEMTDVEKAEADLEKSAEIRVIRTGKLIASDYTQLVDAPVDRQAWHIYRQALRQVPEQDGFPWNVIWPDEPTADAGPDYNTFYNGLLISLVYQAIRVQATQSLPLTVACTEFVAAIADAKVGIPNPPALQACIDNILAGATLTTEELTELQQLLVVSSLDSLYTIPS